MEKVDIGLQSLIITPQEVAGVTLGNCTPPPPPISGNGCKGFGCGNNCLGFFCVG